MSHGRTLGWGVVGMVMGCVLLTAMSFASAETNPDQSQDDRLQVLSEAELKAVVGGAHCDNVYHTAGPCPCEGPSPNTHDPIDLRNGNLFYTFTDVSFPTHAGRRVALTRRYDAQSLSDLENWTPEVGAGPWDVQRGVYNGQGDRSVSAHTYTDVTIELDVRTVVPGEDDNVTEQTAWINFRYDPADDPLQRPKGRYYVVIHKHGAVELWKEETDHDASPEPLTTSDDLERVSHAFVDPTVWNRVRIEHVGANIKVYINEAPIIDVIDSAPLTEAGHVVLESYFSKCQFDNIEITAAANSTSDDFDDPTARYANDYPFGNQWKNNYSDRLWERANGDIVVERASGVRDVFTPGTTPGTYDPPALSYDTLVKDVNNSNGDIYIVETKHKTKRAFDIDGKLKWIEDRNDNRIVLGYTSVQATIDPLIQSDRHTLLVDNFDDDFNGDPQEDLNSLGLATGDDGFLNQRLAVNGAIQLAWDDLGDYWYSKLCLGSLRTDLSKFAELRFDVKGMVGGEDFTIELQTDGGDGVVQVSAYKVLNTNFQLVKIPLEDFVDPPNPSGVDLTKVIAISFVFNAAPSGTIQVDNVRFVDTTSGQTNMTYMVDRLTSITVDPGLAGEREITLQYGLNGKVEKVISPQPTVDDPTKMREYIYTSGPDGNLTEFEDPEGYSHKYEYQIDPMFPNPDDNRTLRKFTKLDNDAAATAYQEVEFHYAYNNRCIKVVGPYHPDDTIKNETHFTYTTSDPDPGDPITHAYVYYAEGDPHTDQDPIPDQPFWEYNFDQVSGNLAAVFTANVDPNGELVYEETWDYYTDPSEMYYTPTNRNRLKSHTSRRVRGQAGGETTTYRYDGKGNIYKITNPKGHVTTYLYHGTFNFVTKIQEANLSNESPPLTRETNFEYNLNNGNLEKIRRSHITQGGTEITTSFDQYDTHGNLETYRDPLQFQDPTKGSWTFGYDDHSATSKPGPPLLPTLL